MYGAGTGYLMRALGGSAVRLAEIHGTRNPLFPGIRPSLFPSPRRACRRSFKEQS
jgi:hypothetical protein